MSYSGFPVPPKSNRSGSGGSPAVPSNAVPTPPTPEPLAPPKPPPIDSVNGRLSEDETTFILRTTLLPEHREDPNVLRFIAGYIRCRDARQAAVEAGLDPRSGANLRARPDIHLAITKLSEKSVMKYGFDASEVIEKIKEIVNVDPVDFLRPDGSYKMLHEMAPEARRAIKKFKAKNLFEKDPNGMPVQIGVLVEIELWDKMKGSELLGREKEIFVEKKKVEHDISANMGSFLLESKKRAEDRQAALAAGSEPILIEARKVDSD